MKKLILIIAIVALGCSGSDDDNNTNNANNANNANNGNNVNNTNNLNNVNNVNNTNNINNVNNGNQPACNVDFAAAQACGGDPIGNWTMVDSCASAAGVDLSGVCANATVGDATADVMGSLVIDATTYNHDASGTFTIPANIPSDCVALVGDCAGVENALGLAGVDAVCTAAAADCACEADFDAVVTDVGAYTLANGVATIDTGSTYYYCVEGNYLTLREFEGAELGPVVGVYQKN